MSNTASAGHRSPPLPSAVVRIHQVPDALPLLGDDPGGSRFDDPRPRTEDRFLMRYAATTLRGCLLELLDWLRVPEEAARREAAVIDNDISDDGAGGDAGSEGGSPAVPPWQALDDYLRGRNVGVITAAGAAVVSINDPALRAELDREPAVRALLDSPDGRATFLPAGSRPSRRVHLDGAVVRHSSDLGRDITCACALALRDRPLPPDVIHYRSRHDDAEDCWAFYDHAKVDVSVSGPFSPGVSAHRAAVHAVTLLWAMPLPPRWQ